MPISERLSNNGVDPTFHNSKNKGFRRQKHRYLLKETQKQRKFPKQGSSAMAHDLHLCASRPMTRTLNNASTWTRHHPSVALPRLLLGGLVDDSTQ